MRLTATVTTLLFIVTCARAQSDRVPAFVKTWQSLFGPPPPPPPPQNSMGLRAASLVQTKWITQKLDHFREQDRRTWQMRYMVNEEYFADGGPIFIYVGGEWSITADRIEYGIIADLAKEHQGILFHTEHRYYGESQPTRDLSTTNLQYLHVRQALADLAHFIRTQRQTDPRLTHSKVIISGCSYSASMALWFSSLYPDLVDGSWASSGPVLARVDFKEYLEVVGQVFLQLGSAQCYGRIQNGIAQLEAMFASGWAAQAKYMLNLCSDFNHRNYLDLWSLFHSIANIFAGIVQFQMEGQVQQWCNALIGFGNDLAAIADIFLNQMSNGRDCVDASYKKALMYLKNTTYNGISRPFTYQMCNEFGWFQTSTSRNQPFGSSFPEDLYTNLCHDVFGVQYTKGNIHQLAADTNAFFGGGSLNVKNVYLTYGSLDPWRPLGRSDSPAASLIAQTSHCADFGSLSHTDSYEMRASKERLIALVRQWLA